MNRSQTITFLGILIIGCIYFAAFLWPNSLGARSETMLQSTSIDEPVTYPYVIRMVTPPHDLREAVNRWLIYGDYHYGYPFYFFSSLTVLPVVWSYGATFENYTSLNLLLLRQVISVLPMILAAGWLVFLQTGFHSRWKAWLLFLALLSMRAIVRNNLQWWHPDALSVLAVVLTLFFLERDRFQFGRHFFLAALACAFAIGIKLAGIFFAPLIAMYLMAGLIRKHLSLVQMVIKAALFILVLLVSLLITNPFLINSGARQEMIAIQLFKTEELDQGYAHDDPLYYQKGPQYWQWTLSNWYGQPLLLTFVALSLLVGCFVGKYRAVNRLILAWTIPYSIYLLWFVAVKPDHYWLPILLPAFSAGLNLWDAWPELLQPVRLTVALRRTAIHVLQAAVLVLLIGWMTTNMLHPFAGAIVRYQQALLVEKQPD